MRFHSRIDETLSITPRSSLNHPERSEGRIANCYSLKVWMQPVNFSAAGIERLKVLEESRREMQRECELHGSLKGTWWPPPVASRDIQPAQANHMPTNFDN